MGVLDLCICAVIAASLLFAAYRGFLHSFFCTISAGLSFLLSLFISPQLIQPVKQIHFITDLITTYTDSGTLIGDTELASSLLSGLSTNKINAILQSVTLPADVEVYLEQKMTQAMNLSASDIRISSYLSAAISDLILQLLCFIACFFLLLFLFQFCITLVNHTVQFPVLRAGDTLAALPLGLVRGVLCALVLALLVPVLEIFLPVRLVSDAAEESWLYAHLPVSALLFQILR